MKNLIIFLFLTLASVFTVAANAQTRQEENLSDTYSRRYDLVASKLGADGVGIETILNDWEKVDSLNLKMLTARFNYYFTKSQTKSIIVKDTKKYLGADPILQLKDSTGRNVNYFQETTYDDSLFSMAMKAVDKIINVYSDRLDMRFLKTAALIAYEKDSPDIALAELLEIIDTDNVGKYKWVYPDVEVDSEFFTSAIQEYCYTFYNMASMSSYQAFRILSERMLEDYPKNTVFMSNMGTYYFIVLKDYKKAVKMYDKVLKIKPDDYTAIKNCVLLARRQKDVRLEKKYLPLLVQYGSDTEKAAAEARLKAL